MKNGQIVGTGRVQDMTKDEVLGMIILGKCPPGAFPAPARWRASGQAAEKLVAWRQSDTSLVFLRGGVFL